MGLFGPPSPSISGGWSAVAAGDFNRDGFPDIVAVNRSAATVTTYFGDGDGALLPSETYVVGAVPEAVTTGDFNGDGWLDIGVADSYDDTVSVLRNRGGPATP
jgi:hypothetical protein